MNAAIHHTAIVSDGAQIGEGTTIGPYSVIGPRVIVGKNNRIGPHVVIEGNTKIGDSNHIFQFSSIGAAPQDLKYKGEDSVLEIGSGNKIREFVTLQPGTEGGGMITKIGNNNLFMANCHIGHDGMVGDSNVIANSAAIAGHVVIGNGVIVGGLVAIHQFVRLGDCCLLGGGAMVVKDIPPYCIAQGDRATLIGVNKVALERKGFSREDVMRVRKLYREVFQGSGSFESRVESARKEFSNFAAATLFLDFIGSTERGIAFASRSQNSEDGDSDNR